MFRLGVYVVALCLSCALAADIDKNEVERILKVINKNVVKLGLQVVPTRDMSYSNIFSKGSIKNANFGDLSTFSVRDGSQIYNITRDKDTMKMTFDVTVGLDKFYVSYDYEFTFLHFIKGEGQLIVTASEDSARLQVQIISKRGESVCTGTLESLTLLNLGGFQAKITPNTIFNKIVSFLVNLTRHISVGTDFSYFDTYIHEYISSEAFKNAFTHVICWITP